VTSPLEQQIQEILAGLEPQDRALAEYRLRPLLTWQAGRLRFPTPGHLSQYWRPEFVQTPMLDILDEALIKADRGEHQRIILNCPPQEGKTSRLQDGCAWLLMQNPRRRVVFASYEQTIAGQSALEIRRLFETHGGGYRGQELLPDHVDVLGLRLDPDRAKQTAWSFADVPGAKGARPGGVVAVGVGSALSGRPADIIVIDDPIKDAKQADSSVWRKAVTEWYQSVVVARLPPTSVIVVVQTRWHEDDLTGWLLAKQEKEGSNEWLHLNIPAQAEGPGDLLGRQPGEYMVSTRGRSVPDWEKRKRDVGTRWWFAQYQGAPAAPEGGIFKRAWFEKHRVSAAPDLTYVITVVDPADNSGDGDEAGIITGGLGEDGRWYLLEDASGHYTVAEWVRQGLFAMFRNGAGRLAYEKSLSKLDKAIRQEWRKIYQQARELVRAQLKWARPGVELKDLMEDWPDAPTAPVLVAAMKALADEDDDQQYLGELQKQLTELWPWVVTVLRLPDAGPPTQAINAVGSKSVRADLASPYWENGKIAHVGPKTKLENQMATWLVTQDSPDRMDAAVHWAHLMAELGEPGQRREKTAPAPTKIPTRTTQGMPANLRATRRGRL
jgi:hypothetical protein